MIDYMTVLEMLSALERGAMTREALATRVREQLNVLEPKVQAFLYVDPEAADRIADPPGSGPLSGIPVGVKDMIDVAGMPTTGGSRAYHRTADEDAFCVAKLRAAGAVIVGKTNTQELAYGVITPPTRNPRNLDYIPGGSSGGSAAAVAAGMVAAALGTDTGGSVRIPASCCGIVGFKPTRDRISTQGVMPLSTTYDHVGVLTHTVSDARYLFHVLTEHPGDSLIRAADGRTERPRPGERASHDRVLAVPWDYIRERTDPEIVQIFEDALGIFRHLGYGFEAVEMEPFDEWKALQLTVRLPEAYLTHREVLEGPRRGLLQGDLAERLDPGREVSALDYLAAQAIRREKIADWTRKMGRYAGLVMPTLPCPVPKVGQEQVQIQGNDVPVWDALVSMTAPWNVVGFPAVSVPCGVDSRGLPVGLQVVGSPMDDDGLLDLAAQFQAAAGIRL
ncbi:amidase [Kyrpidia sp.]|uniref:amidase n=1 Tax=Kyrpidia sp. TaxID=2073077 RepID=UPI0025883607|nr:amidase [Kyrpidia sp.]MCL6576764.1 amidase [Kyrpidia sp.]